MWFRAPQTLPYSFPIDGSAGLEVSHLSKVRGVIDVILIAVTIGDARCAKFGNLGEKHLLMPRTLVKSMIPCKYVPSSTVYPIHCASSCNITMTGKRKHPENQDGESAPYSKRSRCNIPDGSDDLPTSSQSRIDPTYGQRGAFPGLGSSCDDDGLFYGPASDGLEYLRMVR